MKITFCGAAKEVTGSCYHIHGEKSSILVDCGMFQGGRISEARNALDFPFDPTALQSAVITHAHFDHVGRLPKLYKDGFRGALYATRPTIDLAMITLRDAAGLIADEAERNGEAPVFGIEHVEAMASLWKPIEYHQETEVATGMRAFYADAGHILGSASIRLEADGDVTVFSGDLGNHPAPLLRASECLYGADAVVIESTYGNRTHEDPASRIDFLKQALLDTIARQGTLLVPAFAIERTQELLYELNLLFARGEIPQLPVFLDSPMAIKATEVFGKYGNYLEPEEKVPGRGLFSFPGLVFTPSSTESKHIRTVRGPKVVIAGSGMMNGGRILHHLREYLGRTDTLVIIIGFQVEGSLGRRLHEGENRVKIFGADVPVRAEVRSCGAFSGHADQPQLINWLHCFDGGRPKRIYITHGEESRASVFQEVLKTSLPEIETVVPSFGAQATVRK